MFRFWESVILPVFKAVQPGTIVEIGASFGQNTTKILAYCRENEAHLHSIDPSPRFSPEELSREYGDIFIFHDRLSLEALEGIDNMDAVLIDGDHNWYTVYNELKTIENQSRKNDNELPVVFFHDIGWPYGRRDLYYDPGHIPEEHRKPYRQKGLHPDSPDLLEQGGLSPHLCNAVSEGGAGNGVLTAVEDFMEESGQALELIQLPVLFGFGLLYPAKLSAANRDFAEIVKRLSLSEEIAALMEVAERARIDTILNRNKMAERAAELQREVEACRAGQAELEEQLNHKDRTIKELCSERERLKKKNSELNDLLENHYVLVDRLATNIYALFESRRWKMGDAAGRIMRTALGGNREFSAPAEILELLGRLSRSSEEPENRGR